MPTWFVGVSVVQIHLGSYDLTYTFWRKVLKLHQRALVRELRVSGYDEILQVVIVGRRPFD